MIALTLALAVAVSFDSPLSGLVLAQDKQDPELAPATFDKLSAMFRPQAGESRFWDVPWLLSLGEARRKAATEGKPLFIWSGCGGIPITVTSAGGVMGRAPEIWTAAAVETLKERCVSLTIPGEACWRKDADGEFLRNADCVIKTSNTAFAMVTASGKRISFSGSPGPGFDLERWLRGALRGFDALPEEERKAAGSDPAPESDELRPPAGGLVVRVTNRNLARDAEGQLRFVSLGDYQDSPRNTTRYKETAQDFLWVPEPEWKAIVAPAAKKGDTYPAPESFTLRLFRCHLQPSRGFGGEGNFGGARADWGRITLTVEEMTDDLLRLRLDGSAKLKMHEGKPEALTYDPTLLGYLEFDRRKGAFRRFDLLALGDACGKVQHGGGGQRRGPYPLGIAFQLVPNPTTAECAPPHAARRNVRKYLELSSKKPR